MEGVRRSSRLCVSAVVRVKFEAGGLEASEMPGRVWRGSKTRTLCGGAFREALEWSRGEHRRKEEAVGWNAVVESEEEGARWYDGVVGVRRRNP